MTIFKASTNAIVGSLVFVSLLALDGCATHRTITLAEAVGPLHPSMHHDKEVGSLIVYSDTEFYQPPNENRASHSPYRIETKDGQFLMGVRNKKGTFFEEPETVALPVGEYIVRARAANAGMVKVPIVIEAGQTTIVDLNGERLSQECSTGNDSTLVRLPGGAAIGEKAR